MCGSLAQKKMWKINYHLRETHLIDNKMMMIKKSTNEEFTGWCTELCRKGVHAKIDYLEREMESTFAAFRINEIPLIHFECSMLCNDVNFKVFSYDDDDDDDGVDDWYDNFVTPSATNVYVICVRECECECEWACICVCLVFTKYDGNKWDFMGDRISQCVHLIWLIMYVRACLLECVYVSARAY